MTIDTLRMAKRLREAGFIEPQAEGFIASVQAATAGADLATKADIAAVRTELPEVELRFEAKLEAVRADILNRVFAMIFGALVVNIVASFGAMFGVAKLLGR
jgi:hypothetical protein